MRWLSILTLWAGCTNLKDVPLGVCGNGVLEASEECDGHHPGCGVAGGPAACRFTCETARVACPSGYLCGRDKVCRQPTGGFSLSDDIGGPGDRFEVVDFDGDGYPDVLARAPNALRIFHNDRHGGFSLYGAGDAPALPIYNNNGSAGDVRQLSAGGRPLVAALSSTGASLYTASDSGALEPLVFPTSVFPSQKDGKTRTFLGAVVFEPGGTAEPLLYDQLANFLVTYQTGFGVASLPDVKLDLARCGTVGPQPRFSVVTRVRNRSVVGMVLADNLACIAYTASATKGVHSFGVVKLPAPAGSMGFKGPLLLGDYDGDGRIDAACGTSYVDGQGMMQVGTTVWLGTDNGAGPPTLYPASLLLDETSVAGDFNNDHKDEILSYGTVYRSRLEKPDAGFEPANSPSPNNGFGFSSTAHNAAADLNRDQIIDVVLSDQDHGEIAVCVSDGVDPRFTCDPINSAIVGVLGVTVADINGDATNDVAFYGLQPVSTAGARHDGGVNAPPDGGVPVGTVESHLDVSYGRAFGLPDGTLRSVSAFRSTIVGLARAPDANHVADNLLVALTTEGGVLGTALGQAGPNGQLLFGFPSAGGVSGEWEMTRWMDANGDGLADLCLIDGGGQVSIIYGDGDTGFTTGAAQLFDLGQPLDGQSTAFADLPNDPLPVLVWVEPLMNLFHIAYFQHTPSPHYAAKTVALPGGEPQISAQLWVQDISGDGHPEIVVFLRQDGALTCRVLVGSFAEGDDVPHFAEAARYDNCGVYGTPLFAPAARPGGALDLYLPTVVGDGYFERFEPRGDGSYDIAHPLENQPQFRGDFLWMTTVDVNGDSLPDVVLQSPRGLVVALGDVVRR